MRQCDSYQSYRKKEEYYNGYVQLWSLLIVWHSFWFCDLFCNFCLSKLEDSCVLPVPGDLDEFPFIQKLWWWSEKVILIKIKIHACSFLDKRPETGCLSDVDQIGHELNKFGSLQLCMSASYWAKVVEDNLHVPLLPCDEAPNKQIFCQIICEPHKWAACEQSNIAIMCWLVKLFAYNMELWSTMLFQVAETSLWLTRSSQRLRPFLWAMATYLHTINQMQHSSFCTSYVVKDPKWQPKGKSFACSSTCS